MRSGYTLVTCLGTGTFKPNDNGKYKETKYIFEDGKEYSCFVFPKALMEYYKSDLKKVIIIGTVESAWNALIKELDSEESYSLYYQITEEIDSHKGISNNSLLSLEEYLSSIYKGIEFKLLVHEISFQKENLSSILSVYSSIYPNIALNTKLILDITHGFRFMPMLMYQTLQYHGNEFGIDNVKIFYGELGEDKKESFVRDVSDVWKMAEIDKQIYSFKTSFDGIALGQTLKVYDENVLADWIMGFSDMIQKNYVMQIQQAVSELKNILKKRSCSKKIHFIDDLIIYLNGFINIFSTCSVLSDYLFEFAKILNEKGLTTQSIIALRESLWTRLMEKYSPLEIGKYVKDIYDTGYYQAFESSCKSLGIYQEIKELIEERNKIAHAGGDFIKRKLQYRKPDFNKYVEAVATAFSKGAI